MNNKLINAMAFAGLLSGAVEPASSQPLAAANNENSANREISMGVGFAESTKPFIGLMGAGVGPLPEYEGSDDYAMSAMPLVDIQKPGAFFIKGSDININNGQAGAGLTLVHFSYTAQSVQQFQLEFGPLLRAFTGRDESDNKALNGLGDIEQNLGLGAFLHFTVDLWRAKLTSSPQEVSQQKDGLLLGLDIEHDSKLNNQLKLTTVITTNWADDDYMQAYFGVTGSQSALSGYPVFNSKAGFKDVGFMLKGAYTLDRHWLLEVQLGYWRLLNDAAQSPIVKDAGSVNQTRGIIGLMYQF